VYVGTSLDQIVARRISEDTAIPSMQLCIENQDRGGGCDYNYACAYTDTLSWASPTDRSHDPQSANRVRRAVRRRQQQQRTAPSGERPTRASSTGSSAIWRGSSATSAPTDRQRIDKYLADIRELERRIQAVEAKNASWRAARAARGAVRRPDSFAEHMKLMFDIQVLAFESDITRVFLVQDGRDASTRAYPESGTTRRSTRRRITVGASRDTRLQQDQSATT
jgi:hypothetical protein